MAKSVKLTAEVGNTITSTVSKTQAGVRAMQSAIPMLIKHGIVSTMFISPHSKGSKSTATEEQFDWINKHIILGFTASFQKLLESPTKSLTDAKKVTKRYWQQQIGARRNDFKSALARREDSNGAGGKPRTADQRVRDNLNDCLKVIDNVEDSTQLVQGAEIKALLKKAIALLTSK